MSAIDPGEASQFDWSEDFAVLGGERTKLQMAHIKLSHSRAFLLRAYPLQTGLRPFRAGLIHWINPVSPSPHEMLFDATGTRSGCQRRRQNRPRGGAKVGQWRGTKRHGACAAQI
ncbi:hypothetical protein ABIE57_003773, partial [Roseovarius sp. MBR-6]